jgi:hypothetical protein
MWFQEDLEENCFYWRKKKPLPSRCRSWKISWIFWRTHSCKETVEEIETTENEGLEERKTVVVGKWCCWEEEMCYWRQSLEDNDAEEEAEEIEDLTGETADEDTMPSF